MMFLIVLSDSYDGIAGSSNPLEKCPYSENANPGSIALWPDGNAKPDTPTKARPLDWAVATSSFKLNIPIVTVEHAIRLATLRRLFRDDAFGPLEPVRSLAYYRPLVYQIHNETHDPGYVQYIVEKYRESLPS